jgi:hypothetical protein
LDDPRVVSALRALLGDGMEEDAVEISFRGTPDQWRNAMRAALVAADASDPLRSAIRAVFHEMPQADSLPAPNGS